jgi:hypothetical protein
VALSNSTPASILATPTARHPLAIVPRVPEMCYTPSMSDSSDLSRFSASFAEHLQQTPHGRLYHYTSQEGLLGIVKSGTLWATNISYMNDATEFHQPRNMLRDCVSEELERQAKTAGAPVDRLELLRGKLNKVKDTLICVACFCEDGDLLSQWRGYSGRGYGYSLGFNYALLKEKTTSAGFILGKCIYCPERQKKS